MEEVDDDWSLSINLITWYLKTLIQDSEFGMTYWSIRGQRMEQKEGIICSISIWWNTWCNCCTKILTYRTEGCLERTFDYIKEVFDQEFNNCGI